MVVKCEGFCGRVVKLTVLQSRERERVSVRGVRQKGVRPSSRGVRPSSISGNTTASGKLEEEEDELDDADADMLKQKKYKTTPGGTEKNCLERTFWEWEWRVAEAKWSLNVNFRAKPLGGR